MNKKLFLLLTSLGLLACNLLFPPSLTPPQTPEIATEALPSEATTATPLADTQSSPTMTPTKKSEVITMPGFMITRLHPEDGDLHTMLAEEAQKAFAFNLIPVVEFDATWCPPCQAIDAAMEDRNELMLKAYEGIYIIKLDVDEWGWTGGGVQDFRFEGIPVYFKLDKNGEQTGEVIDGNAWGKDIPENIAPVMDKFFHGGR